MVDTMLRASRALDEHGVPHVFGGSFVGWLHGAERTPADVDVFVSACAFDAACAAEGIESGRNAVLAAGALRSLARSPLPALDVCAATEHTMGRQWRVDGAPIATPEFLVFRKLLRARASLDAETVRAAESARGTSSGMRLPGAMFDALDAWSIIAANGDVMACPGLPRVEGIARAAQLMCNHGGVTAAALDALAALPMTDALALLDVAPLPPSRRPVGAPLTVNRSAPRSRHETR
jgi:hypothetical protein